MTTITKSTDPLRLHRRPRLPFLLLLTLSLGLLGSVGRAATPPAGAKPIPRIGFERLAAFPFVIPTAPATAQDVLRQIPEDIRALDGQTVVVTGYLMPVKFERGLTTEFLLLASSQLCCFGVTPAMNAWMTVTLPAGTPPKQDVPLSFRGKLRVGPKWDNGWLASIYQLEAEALDRPGALTERPFTFPADGGRH